MTWLLLQPWQMQTRSTPSVCTFHSKRPRPIRSVSPEETLNSEHFTKGNTISCSSWDFRRTAPWVKRILVVGQLHFVHGLCGYLNLWPSGSQAKSLQTEFKKSLDYWEVLMFWRTCRLALLSFFCPQQNKGRVYVQKHKASKQRPLGFYVITKLQIGWHWSNLCKTFHLFI